MSPRGAARLGSLPVVVVVRPGLGLGQRRVENVALVGRVEVLNTQAIEARLAALYPLVANRAARPPLPHLPPARRRR